MSTTIDLGKLRFNWVGEWASNVQYESNDLVRHGGDVHVYIYGLKTTGNVPTDTVYWALVQEGLSWKGEYAPATAYKRHEVVHHANNAYVCILSEPAAGNAPPDVTYWQLLATGIKFEGAYDNAVAYQKDDIVYYGANTYICVDNTPGNNLPTDAAYWSTFSHGLDWKGEYDNAFGYKKSDVVSYGANTFIARADTVGNLPNDDAEWEQMTSGVQWEGDWDNSVTYQKDDIVRVGGDTFIARVLNTGDDPVTVGVSWEAMSSNIRSRGDWETNAVYAKDDVVSYGGQTFIVVTGHQSTVFATDLSNANWERFSGGLDWKGNWATSVDYKVNDLVNSGGAVFIAIADHTSSVFGSESANWTSFANAGTDVALTITSHGDMLFRGASAPERLPAGIVGQLLTAGGPNASPSWETISLVVPGQALYGFGSGAYSWTCPAGVTSVCVVCIGGGAGSNGVSAGNGGGGGGGLGWKNNIAVTPGNVYVVHVGWGGDKSRSANSSGGDSYFINTSTVKGGGAANGTAGGSFTGDGGGNGGSSGGSQAGAGAAGYTGNGGTQNTAGLGGGAGGGYNYSSTWGYSSGGGTGPFGQGSSGASTTYGGGIGGSGGENGVGGENPWYSKGNVTRPGGLYGGGGGGAGSNASWPNSLQIGGRGCVRIIWGEGRSFPSTGTGDM